MQMKFMKRAMALAKKGEGFCSPNPCVGAVIVKDNKILSEGWHKKAGEDHAEIVAMKNSKMNRFKDCELYVTLEPCSHQGKTPPCAKAIVKGNFKKVFIGMKDPNKLVNGKGIKMLKENGIETELLKENQETRMLNQPFIKSIKYGFPYITLKYASSLDGKTALPNGDSKWITSEIARKDARKLRSLHDAVLVGANTINRDNPLLKLDAKYKNKKFWRIIVSRDLNVDPDSKIFNLSDVFIATTERGLKHKAGIARLKKKNVEILSFGSEKVSFKKLFTYLLKEKRVQSLYVEGGSSLSGTLFDEFLNNPKLIDKVIAYISPKLIGGKNSLSPISGIGIKKVSKAINLKNIEVLSLGKDLRISGIINCY